VEVIWDPVLGRVWPRHTFFGVLFRQYPVARVAPTGLSPSNVFVVGPAGKAQPLKSSKELEQFFEENLPAARGDEQLKNAARAWLLLSQQFYQDGFFKFALEDDATRVSTAEGVKAVTGKVVAMRGGNGAIKATLRFDRSGKLLGVTEKAELRPGPRPICQATKLLDPDPVVRRMAEQDLLIMGRYARPYLDEQRAKASPELRRAIDRIRRRIADEGP
jgi:hypothetical protein